MTFEQLAISLFGDMSEIELAKVAGAMEWAYIASLESVSFEIDGEKFVGFGKKAKKLVEVKREIRLKGGPI